MIFDENTDYDEVLLDTKLKLANKVAIQGACGCNSELNCEICDTITYITVAEINKDNLDQIRYEEAVESAYLSLDCNCS